MAVYGIIAEYNPFHNGHQYQLQKIREKDPAASFICVMSGSFTQRGEAALLDKWQRASLAVAGGIDLVLELPFVFAVRSAQDFARGGLTLLHRLGLVDFLAFGSEYTDTARLEAAAQAIDDSRLQPRLKENLARGISYGAALCQALAEATGIPEDCLRQPNTILALEYLRSLRRLASPIRPLPLQRKTAGYHDQHIQAAIASASAIRRELYKPAPDPALLGQSLPPASYQAVRAAEKDLPQREQLLRPLLLTLYRASLPELQHCYGISEGLENRLLQAAPSCTTLQELVDAIRSRRYPQSRVQRLFLYLLLQISRETVQAMDAAGPLYGRILAMNSTGAGLLHRCKAAARLPLIAKTSQFLTSAACRQPQALTPLQQMLALDIQATGLYSLCFQTPRSPLEDFLTSPRLL